MCHRDLKPENLMFTDDTYTTLKLIDFGEARSCAEGRIKEYVGTTDYMAPEVIKGTNSPTIGWFSLKSTFQVENMTPVWTCGLLAL